LKEVKFMAEPKLKIAYWNVTSECNQRCQYCWLGAGTSMESELNTDQWLTVFNTIIDLGLEAVKVTGGEPLLHWQKIKPVLEFFIDHGIKITMETNGTLLIGEYSQDILSLLSNECVTSLSVSLDSSSPQKHDTYRGMKGAFEKTVKALHLLKDNNIPFSVVTVIHNQNYTDIQDIIDFVNTLRPLYHQMNITMPEGRAKINTEYQLTAEFYVYNLPTVIQNIRKEAGTKVRFNVPYIFNPYDRDFLNCSVGSNICGFLPTGDIAVCAAGIKKRELVLGNALTDDIKDIWVNSPAFLALRKDIFTSKGICGNCLFARYCRGYCRANSFAVYGQLDAPFPICQMLYEEGIFPEKYMIDPAQDCSL
jgi:radical SAM protein with 4Fe4S-binding SPASM domain